MRADARCRASGARSTTTSTRTRAPGAAGIWRVSRTRGHCSCGARWPEGNSDNLVYADVREFWLDHVEREFYKQADEATT